MDGLHLTADLYQCAAAQLLVDEPALAALCRGEVVRAGLTPVAERWHHFANEQGQPGGITGVLLLKESHVAIHTWPERSAVTLDIYVCNYGRDNSARAESLLAALLATLAPQNQTINRLQRGIEEPVPAP